MTFNKEKIQLFWIPFIGLTAKDIKIIPDLRAGANIAGLTIIVNFHVFQWTPCHQTLGSFSRPGNAPGSLASLLTRAVSD